MGLYRLSPIIKQQKQINIQASILNYFDFIRIHYARN